MCAGGGCTPGCGALRVRCPTPAVRMVKWKASPFSSFTHSSVVQKVNSQYKNRAPMAANEWSHVRCRPLAGPAHPSRLRPPRRPQQPQIPGHPVRGARPVVRAPLLAPGLRATPGSCATHQACAAGDAWPARPDVPSSPPPLHRSPFNCSSTPCHLPPNTPCRPPTTRRYARMAEDAVKAARLARKQSAAAPGRSAGRGAKAAPPVQRPAPSFESVCRWAGGASACVPLLWAWAGQGELLRSSGLLPRSFC